MARLTIAPVRLSELVPGQHADFFALLTERSRKATQGGKPFYLCQFRDARRTVSAVIWSDGPHFDSCEKEWKEGRFYKLRGLYQEHERYGPQIEIKMLRGVVEEDRKDGFQEGDLVERSRFDSESMFRELRILAEKNIHDEPLARLVLLLLDRHAEALKRLPATTNKFYPFCGGLLEHLLHVTHVCLELVELYAARYSELTPPLNRDLVIAGAILHDIGRVAELVADGASVQQTVAGRFLGHIHLGRDLVRDAAREVGDVNPELLQMLEHIVLSHLTLPEWGSPRLPLIPECLIIHHADDLDAKMEMYVRCLNTDKSGDAFTVRDPVLGKQLYKGRTV